MAVRFKPFMNKNKYEAKLVSEVEPGMVIEAMPGSNATKDVPQGAPNWNQKPSGFFGYVRGRLDLNNFDVATPYNQLWIVERILPKSTYSHKLVDWVVGETPCLAVGKIKGMRPNKDFIGNQLERKSVGLSPREIEIIQPQLVHFYADRGLANWAYTEQDGSQTPLRELALNLTQA